ncbi:MAG TPA: DUF6152 family protein [Micropepsaceae bacterium]|nr:DUF6152 family protein [Micropepsaceae bacterium]
MKARPFALILSLATLGLVPASAHHSFAMYDREKTMTLSGTVKEFNWTSPHVTIQVLAASKSGPAIWSIEGGSPNILMRGGWTSTLLRNGDKVSLGIHPRKDGAVGGLLADEQQVLVNGHPACGVLFLQPAGEETCAR